MFGRIFSRLKFAVVLLFLIAFVSLNSQSVSAQCITRSFDEMRPLLINITNFTLSGDNKLYDRFALGTSKVHIWETAYIFSDKSVRISLFSYDNESVAALDATVYPTSTKTKDWNETTFKGHRAYQKATTVISSEYLDYSVDLRVVDGCLVVRGWWHEKIRRYEPLVTLEEGIESVSTVVGAIVDEIDSRTTPYVEPPPVNVTSPDGNATFPESEATPLEETKPRIVVLANSIDYSLAMGFFGFLEGRGFDVVHATAGDFDQYSHEKFVVVLGGPDAYEGVGGIVQGILTMTEGNSIREAGVRKRYTKSDVWAQGQTVVVIAGSNRQNTQKSGEEQRNAIATEATEATQ
jgi:hypothetical protein